MTARTALPVRPRAVLFDMDGVLIESFDAWVAVVGECRVRRGLAPLGPAEVRAIWGQGIAADCETLYPGADPREIAREYDAGFAEHVQLVAPMSGASQVVAALRGARIPLALVTNSPVGLARRVLTHVGMTGDFSVIAGGDEVRHGKPAPDLVVLALERLNVAPKDAVLVGDTQLDVAAARSAGAPVVGYRTPGDWTIDDLRELLPLLGVQAV